MQRAQAWRSLPVELRRDGLCSAQIPSPARQTEPTSGVCD